MTRKTISAYALRGGVVVLWAALTVVGARTLLNYENTPGIPGAPPAQWPRASRLVRFNGKFTLVMLAHPNCPCTRASIAELDILMARAQGKLTAFVVFSKPGASAADMKLSDLWKAAARIPDVAVLDDSCGVETERFGGQVSGQTMLYDPAGQLIFSGGITGGRGHQGENAGLDAVVLKVRGLAAAQSHVAVFGCALHNPAADELRNKSWTKQ